MLARRDQRGDRLEVENLRPRYVRLGDSGEVAYEAFAEAGRDETTRRPSRSPKPKALIGRLSETRGTKNKRRCSSKLRARATPSRRSISSNCSSATCDRFEGGAGRRRRRARVRPAAGAGGARQHAHGRHRRDGRARAPRRVRGVAMRLFHPIKFMLATAAEDLADIARTMPEEFYVEDKFDGIRAQAHTSKADASRSTRARSTR